MIDPNLLFPSSTKYPIQESDTAGKSDDYSFAGVIAPIIGGQIRHLATVAAGALLAAGAILPENQSSFVEIASGIGMWGVVAGWSWWQKVGQAKALEALHLKNLWNKKEIKNANNSTT